MLLHRPVQLVVAHRRLLLSSLRHSSPLKATTAVLSASPLTTADVTVALWSDYSRALARGPNAMRLHTSRMARRCDSSLGASASSARCFASKTCSASIVRIGTS